MSRSTRRAREGLGLVNAVAAPSEVETLRMNAARQIAAMPPEAVLASRRLMRARQGRDLGRIDDEADHFRDRLQSAEAKAALEAFFNRKK